MLDGDGSVQSGGNGATEAAQTSAGTSETGKISGLRVEAFHGSRNPQVYKDWKQSVEAIRYISDLAPGKLAVAAYMSPSGEARDLTRHIELSELPGLDRVLCCVCLGDARCISGRKCVSTLVCAAFC